MNWHGTPPQVSGLPVAQIQWQGQERCHYVEAIVERLLKDLAPLDDRLWLVVDDTHELGPDALRQLELLLMRAPEELRFVLATRHDVRRGLHRLRLEGELAEIREPDCGSPWQVRPPTGGPLARYVFAAIQLRAARRPTSLRSMTEAAASGCMKVTPGLSSARAPMMFRLGRGLAARTTPSQAVSATAAWCRRGLPGRGRVR